MNPPIFSCNYQGHEMEPIIGYCFNLKCQQSIQYCNQCLIYKHQTHQKDCKSINQISNLLTEYGNTLTQWSQNLDQYWKKIQKLYQRLRKFVYDQQNKNKELETMMQNQNFHQFGLNVKNFSKVYKIQHYLQSKNFIKYSDMLEKIIINTETFIQNTQDLDTQIQGLNQSVETFNYLNQQAPPIKTVEQLLMAGIELNKSKQYDDAIFYFDKVFEKEPNNPEAHYNKGIALYEQKKYNEAIEYYDKAIDINPQSKFFVNKGLALIEIAEFEKAHYFFDYAIALDPHNYAAYLNKGISLRNLQKFQQALQCYDEAINVDPNKHQAYHNKSIILLELSHFNQAAECCDAIIKLDPSNIRAYLNKSKALRKLGRDTEADQCKMTADKLKQSQ